MYLYILINVELVVCYNVFMRFSFNIVGMHK